jgi:hypothetical protein
MLEWIRIFDLKKTGIVNVSAGLINIIVHVLVILKILPYQWVNGGRTESYEMACQISVASIVVMIVCILITMIASKIIPLKLNRFGGIALSVLLIAMLPLSLLGVVQQFLGTLFEKCVMSAVAAIGFCSAARIAIEKRW